MFVSLAIYLVLHTGCRPKEAALIVYYRSIEANDFQIPHLKRPFKATVKAEFTKTRMDYFWLLSKDRRAFVKQIRQHPDTGYASFENLHKGLK